MRRKPSPTDNRDFRRWMLARSEQLAQCGLPLHVWESQDNWVYFLDHSYLPHDVDPSGFDLEQLSPTQLRELADLVRAWRGDGFELDVEGTILAVERKRLKARHPRLFADLAAYLYTRDPMQRRLGSNRDQYEPVVGTILPRVFDLDSVTDAAQVIRDELRRWWKDDIRADDVTCEELATGILAILERHRKGRPRPTSHLG